MYTVRKATTNDVIAIRMQLQKAWYNTYLNIYAVSTINELLAASYNEHHLKSDQKINFFQLLKKIMKLQDLLTLSMVKNYTQPHIMFTQVYNIKVMEQVYLKKDYMNLKMNMIRSFQKLIIRTKEAIHYYQHHGFEIVRSYQPEMYGEQLDLALMKKVL